MSNEQELFNMMANAIEEYLKQYGHPHLTIIATQNGVEVMEGTKARKFELQD